MAEIIEYPSKTEPNDDDVIILEDSESNSTKQMTRGNFLKVPSDTTIIETTSLLNPATKKTYITSLATNITLSTIDPALENPEEFFVIHMKDNGSPKSILYDASYKAIGVTPPSVTVANKELYIVCAYNAATEKVNIVSVGREA
jgi:hypothetical protein